MSGWLKRLVILAVAAALARTLLRRRGGHEFDAAKPSIAWGTTSLVIDEPEEAR